MSYDVWIVACILGIFLAFVVAALHQANKRVRALYADKAIMGRD